MILPSEVAGSTTSEVGYFAADARALANWLQPRLGAPWSVARPPWGDQVDALKALSPQAAISIYAFIDIGDGWALLLNNGPLGTDVGLLPSRVSETLGCRSIRAVSTDGRRRPPARVLEVYGPGGQPPFGLKRSIVAADDGGRWVFEMSGEAFPFEDQTAYARRLKSDRFPRELLYHYLEALGVPIHSAPAWADARTVERKVGGVTR